MKYILEKCLGMLVYIIEMFKNPIKKANKRIILFFSTGFYINVNVLLQLRRLS